MTKFDPTKIFVGTRLYKDTDERGSVILDETTNEWKEGELVIELLDIKTAQVIASHKERTTRNKYRVWQEDFNDLSKEDIIKKYFPDTDLTEASETELDKSARESQVATAEAKLQEALDRVAELEKEAEARDAIDEGAFEAAVEETPEEVVKEKKPKK